MARLRERGARVRKRGFESAVAPRYARRTDGVAELANLANAYNLRRWSRRAKCWRHLDDPLEK